MLAGLTNGSWTEPNLGGNDSFAVMLDMKNAIFETPAPTMSETTPPTTSYTPPPPMLEDPIPSPLYSATFSPTMRSASISDTKSEQSSIKAIITAVSVVAAIVLLVFGAVTFIQRRRKSRGKKFKGIQARSSSNPDSKGHEVGERRPTYVSSWNRHAAIRSSRSHTNPLERVSSKRLTASGSEIGVNSRDLGRTPAMVEKRSPGHSLETSEVRNSSQVTSSHRSMAFVTSDGVGDADAVQDAAHILTDSCPLPLVTEAAALVSILAKLIGNSAGNAVERESKLKRCWSILKVLERSAEVLAKVMGSLSNYTIAKASLRNCEVECI